MKHKLRALAGKLKGQLHFDEVMRTLYATDASAYREMPLAVAIPDRISDLKALIAFARAEKVPLIPRTAGTSLAGQVVGYGIVVDVSRKFTRVLEVNQAEGWVRVEPGVVRDELNVHLAPYGLYFGPETSTANRAMIGGMVGNNSCGSNSIIYGSTRDHLLEATVLLSDGSEVVLKALDEKEFQAKCQGNTLENKLYQHIAGILSEPKNQASIRKEFPKPSIPRRNTGYALDLLLETAPFTPGKGAFNFCKLLAGSEGTLAFITEVKLHVDPLPPAHKALVCGHFHTIDESLKANLIALQYNPSACELMDHYILECTKSNIEQRHNRFFVQGDPGAILAVEIARDSQEEVEKTCQQLIDAMQVAGYGYHFPIVTGEDVKKVWNLRKAGLGLLSNMPGDAKPVPVIEDTAVDVADLPAYIAAFNETLKKHGLYCVHYAHAGSGELHLRPILDLKTAEGNHMFRVVAEEIARLVKQYNGSLSGEHGDGRLRGEFIRWMVGDPNYQLIESVKRTWDPDGIFNPGKIVDTPPMNTSLRYMPGQKTLEVHTVFDFSETLGYQRAAEMCNGSGDCRKTEISGGTMCPSYMATRNEKDTTRARANILREVLTHSTAANPFTDPAIEEVMDLCLSCKGCKSECPSNVDVAKLKAEFLQQKYDTQGVPLRSWLIGNFARLNHLAAKVPWAYNLAFTLPVVSTLAKKVSGFAPERSIPLLHKTTLNKWYKQHRANGAAKVQNGTAQRKVYFFSDEFTNYNDTPIGITAIQLLEKLGYEVIVPRHVASGRALISKGLLRDARKLAIQNVDLLSALVSEETPIIGLEPSAILTLRDEYPDLVLADRKEAARHLAKHALLIDEFLAKEMDCGFVRKEQFTQEKKLIKLHGHCHQKALSSLTPTKKILSLPANYTVHLIRSGCCGMAGSFGYEAEHYALSMQIGELVLFPAVRQAPPEVLIAAPGTSCRHQIKDGTGRVAQHPVEILWEALLK